jgi:hypothetical protein
MAYNPKREPVKHPHVKIIFQAKGSLMILPENAYNALQCTAMHTQQCPSCAGVWVHKRTVHG